MHSTYMFLFNVMTLKTDHFNAMTIAIYSLIRNINRSCRLYNYKWCLRQNEHTFQGTQKGEKRNI